ncbi:uncharacterized protein LAESUDRAFT_719020 [Laetiporus sulphureus 93-53]|uniref:Uncharacterized protein n=1 Tax=Laetiporus sulphureus 93-53 TaxID=1314785 RepID=A0A165I8E0_9APHY|nr:uncharacterized protein LAESUDRAFT_719020 [Laetiporus sulphureus 93-53]KZT12725.1 hypothetical protein LAESUDRAFT_719020 [Laetiporus sulphureus 93-53]
MFVGLSVLLLLFAGSLAGFVVQTMNVAGLRRRLDNIVPSEQERNAFRQIWDEQRRAHTEERAQWDREHEAHELQRAEWRKSQEEWEAEREERQREKDEWEREWNKWMQVYERKRHEWVEEFARQRREWEADWAKEKHQREKERQEDNVRRHWDEGKRLGLSWQDMDGHRCLFYGTREYTARLDMDVMEACRQMPLEHHGNLLDIPRTCEILDSKLITHFELDDAVCMPTWGPINNKGCAGRGKRRYEARLNGVRNGDSWEVMCSTTPATINDMYFESPTSCENRGWWSGEVGIWLVDDWRCS